MTAAESALERQLSTTITRGARPRVSRVDVGRTLVEQVGPGAVPGERAGLADGRRTSTLRAVTACRVARASRAEIDPDALEQLAEGHRREDDAT